MARARYHAKPIKQKLVAQGHLIGCTDTSFAMLVDAATLGGCIVTESIVRALSDEKHPDPESPGLNLGQLDDVAKKLHVEFDNMTGHDRNDMAAALRANCRVVAQLWYSGIGGSNIGHAVYVEQLNNGNARIVDPMKGAYQWIDQTKLFDAMRTFAEKTGLKTGLRYGQSRPTQWLSANQKPQTP